MGDDALHVVCSSERVGRDIARYSLFRKPIWDKNKDAQDFSKNMFLLRNATILAAKVGLKFNPCISPSSRFEIEDPVQGFEELKNKQEC